MEPDSPPGPQQGAAGQPAEDADYLAGHPRYTQVISPGSGSRSPRGRLAPAAARRAGGQGKNPPHARRGVAGVARSCREAVACPAPPQIRYLNRGAYGFVVLAHDAATNEQVALKFIKRGPQVR